MNKEEKAIKILNNFLDEPVRYGYRNKIANNEIEAIETLLNLIQKHEAIIDKMAEKLTTPVHSKQWVIEYYEKEVEKEC